MKKLIAILLMLLSFGLVSCEKTDLPNDNVETPETPDNGSTETPGTGGSTGGSTETPGTGGSTGGNTQAPSDDTKYNKLGYVDGKIGDFSQYENTNAYVQVTTAKEFLDAIKKAKYTYDNKWHFEARDGIMITVPKKPDSEGKVNGTEELAEKVVVDEYHELEAKRQNNTITSAEKTRRETLEKQLFYANTPIKVDQTLTSAGTVHVIEIMNDLELGYNTLQQLGCDMSVADNFVDQRKINSVSMSDIYTNYGISQIKFEGITDLMVYSKNGAKLTHCGFKVSKSTNMVFRNLEFDEIWQWEDSASATPSLTIGDYDAFGCAYFKLHTCGYVWIDHCTFGKAYDGLIDIAHPVSEQTGRYAPYGNTSENGVHISNCNFKAGSDDEDGYLYKMMKAIDDDVNLNGENTKYKYYKTLKDMGCTFEEILYGIAIPQKKGFLLGDSGDCYEYNIESKISFANCYFKNIEDRLPKIRGGIVYMYNCVIDALEYMEYRDILIEKGCKDIQTKNAKYKCALVSQGIVAGLGAIFRAENCMYLGVDNLLKNNDSNPTKFFHLDVNSLTSNEKFEYKKAQYSLINVKYQANKDAKSYTGTTEMDTNKFNEENANVTSLLQVLTANIDWRNEGNKKPFNPKLIELRDLEKELLETNPVGVCENLA